MVEINGKKKPYGKGSKIKSKSLYDDNYYTEKEQQLASSVLLNDDEMNIFQKLPFFLEAGKNNKTTAEYNEWKAMVSESIGGQYDEEEDYDYDDDTYDSFGSTITSYFGESMNRQIQLEFSRRAASSFKKKQPGRASQRMHHHHHHQQQQQQGAAPGNDVLDTLNMLRGLSSSIPTGDIPNEQVNETIDTLKRLCDKLQKISMMHDDDNNNNMESMIQHNNNTSTRKNSINTSVQGSKEKGDSVNTCSTTKGSASTLPTRVTNRQRNSSREKSSKGGKSSYKTAKDRIDDNLVPCLILAPTKSRRRQHDDDQDKAKAADPINTMSLMPPKRKSSSDDNKKYTVDKKNQKREEEKSTINKEVDASFCIETEKNKDATTDTMEVKEKGGKKVKKRKNFLRRLLGGKRKGR